MSLCLRGIPCSRWRRRLNYAMCEGCRLTVCFMECCGRRDTYSADILCPARLYFFFCFVMIADVNGDQIPDMIALDGYIVTTLLGNGDGTFRAGPSTNAPWQAIYDGVAVDVNGDGIVDLV